MEPPDGLFVQLVVYYNRSVGKDRSMGNNEQTDLTLKKGVLHKRQLNIVINFILHAKLDFFF